MASADAAAAVVDTLITLRRAVSSNVQPVPTKSLDASASDAEPNIAKATYLLFNFTNETPISFELSSPTRFISSGNTVDFRSIYLAWLNKDATVTDYLAATRSVNADLANTAEGGAGGEVKNLIFAEKLDLITWLEGAGDSEYIKPLAEDERLRDAQREAAIARGDADGSMRDANGVAAGALRSGQRELDPRLQEIYNSERKMGDRNSCLRGIKPTDFSHVRKSAELFLGRTSRPRPGTTAPIPPPSAHNPLISNLKKPSNAPSGGGGRRPEPIILLSPSASSLLRMTNIKSFLVDGLYQPPDTSTATPNILHISRTLPSISSHPLRFILVDTPDQFKPDYWGRVVAIFTTGQAWQFKSYKWQQPAELFSHALGVYVGWRGEEVPATVKGWGRQVVSVQVDKWNPSQGTKGRWRDREVVEGVWGNIEQSMRARGWGKEGR
ncbi:CDC73-domain-containing protein [Viridothelium virens]|uniref:CDC73-domain-containing protein n=1 Tax=Viridothelium virens TaxID=1048519 RepID=A0A6A6HFS7_VIRVR|nr:CDC73-domain-containing protein [Viridothelium virens]